MKKRVAFRSFVILLAAVMLLSSTSAYNILVYANQDSVANSLSAIESSSEAAVTEPNIAVQGGSLELNADSTTTENTDFTWKGTGTAEDPYQIESVEHFMSVNRLVNGMENTHYIDQKHFVLTADIDLSEWFADPQNKISNITGGTAGNAYLITTSATNPNHYINLSGAHTVTDESGNKVTNYHTISFEGASDKFNIETYDNFAIFGYLNSKSVISDVIFENININVTSDVAQGISVISYRNDGEIRNCEINKSSINLELNTSDSVYGAGSSEAYYGFAAAVADNRGSVRGVKVNNFTVTTASTATNDYIGGLVAQNRGTVENSSVSGIKFAFGGNSVNHYVGGLVAYNIAVIKSSTVDMAGNDNITENIRGGGYVGGLVGLNDAGNNAIGTIEDCSVTGSFNSSQVTSYSSYNIFGEAVANNNVDIGNNTVENRACFGGIAGLNLGSISNTTVADLGFYMNGSSVSHTGYFGGITAKTTGGSVTASVASGTFVAHSSAVYYSGGIVAYAESNETETVRDCYALFNLNANSSATKLVGAVVGYGGTTNTAVNCYWSDAISGCVTAYVIPDKNDSQKPAAIEASVGKLISANRAVKMARGAQRDFAASLFTHSFEKIQNSSIEPATITTNNAVSVSGVGLNNNIIKEAYSATLNMPVVSDANGVRALVGSTDKASMPIWFNLDIFVVSDSVVGDPDDINDPLEITSSAMVKFIYEAPYGHYELKTNLAVLKDSWKSCNFTGTIEGNGYTLSTETPLFNNVMGSREKNGMVYNDAEETVTDPQRDTADRSRGAVFNLKVELSSDIRKAVFGNVYNATFISVSLTDGDPTPDDGNAEGGNGYEGYVAEISERYTAAFINSAMGFSYIYGCSTDVSAELADVSDIAVFIAYVSGMVYIDNCAVTAVSAYVGPGENYNRAVFLANVTDNDGMVVNSIVSARVVGTGSCYIVMGSNRTSNSNLYKNITWSKLQYHTPEKDSDMTTQDLALWGSNDDSYSNIQKNANASATTSYTIALPKNVSAFSKVSVDDLSVSLINITEGKNDSGETVYSESEYTGDDTGVKFVLENVSVNNGDIVIAVKNTAEAGEHVWVKVFHYETGFITYVKLQVVATEFSLGDDGYYHISTPEQLVKFAELTNSDDNDWRGYAYKIDNDINMDGIAYTPACLSAPFTGHISAEGPDGQIYTIRNLTISGNGNVALIASAVSGQKVPVTGGEVDSGIYNIRIENVTVTATGEDSNAAVLVANSSTNSSTATTVDIHNVEIVNATVITQGKNAAAVLANSLNSAPQISGIVLDNVAIRSSNGQAKFINASSTGALSGGIAGIVGAISYNMSNSTHNVSVTDVNINGLSLTGSAIDENTYNYAQLNAGAIIGTYQRYFDSTNINVHKLNVGAAHADGSYDIVINDLFIKSAGISGGAIGSTNAQTTVDSIKVSASQGKRSAVRSTTDQFIGGIAGHIGSYASDGPDIMDTYVSNNIYSKVSNCLVERTDIVAENPAITDASVTMSRNVAVGGIAGAINGPAQGNTVENCTVSDCLVEGVVVGGIIGSNVSRTFIDGNIIRIDSCEVLNTTVTTPENCVLRSGGPTFSTSTMASFGVGGILGTNRYAQDSYASVVSVKYCNVDSETEINNYSILSNDVYVPTGGIIGFASLYYDENDAESMLLQYNSVSASIYASADAQVTSAADNTVTTAVRTGTAGFVGMYGSIDSLYESVISPQLWQYQLTTPSDIAYTNYLHISDSVFSGTVSGADCVAGAIGAFINTTSCIESYGSFAPEQPILDNIVISGLLNSTAQSNLALIRGGIAVGHISYYQVYYPGEGDIFDNEVYAMQYDDTDLAFSDIYYSSLNIDKSQFPLLGYMGLNQSVINTVPGMFDPFIYPVYASALAALSDSYIDVNSKSSDNKTVQITDKQNIATSVTVSGANAPEVTRGSLFTLTPDASLGTTNWKSSNSSIAAVAPGSTYQSVTVLAKSNSPIPAVISIDYVGQLTGDNGWSCVVRLPVGFRVVSTAVKQLDYVMVGNDKYELISEPSDFYEIKADGKYWLKNDIVFTPDLFESSGSFAGGYSFKGTFTGVLESMPVQDNYTVHSSGGSTYTHNSTQETMTISGLEYAAYKYGNSDTDTAAALFANVNGATFKNFILSEVKSTSAVKYAAAVAAVVTGSLTAENVIVKDSQISGAEYSGGLFGGMFKASGSDPWNITDCKLEGTRVTNGEDYSYSTNISGTVGAAGIVVHTNQIPANIKGVTVSGSMISQSNSEFDTSYFDRGAAGISLAFSGSIEANGEKRNEVKESCIIGEVASGAVMRTYSSTASDTFGSNNLIDSTVIASELSVSGLDIKDSCIKGTHTYVPDDNANKLYASGGILARVAAAGVPHSITDCTLDEKTVVEALYSAGGIVGCFEEGNALDKVDTYKMNLTVDGCVNNATVKTTSSVTIYTGVAKYNLGTGGIIGAISRYVGFNGINIRNCTVGGTIVANNTVGGIFGAIWANANSATPPTSMRLDLMTSHMVENCVVSADFRNSEGAEAFNASNSTTGLVVGYVFDAARNASNVFDVSASADVSDSTGFKAANYPFYNIYYPAHKYPSGSTYLFGIRGSGNSSNELSLNYKSDGSYVCYTDYVYDINYVYTDKQGNVARPNINTGTLALEFSDAYRVQQKDSQENGIWVIDYRSLGTGLVFDIGNGKDFLFNTAPAGAAESDVTYRFDSSASLERFVLSDSNASSVTTTAQLEKITADSPIVIIEHIADGQYILKTLSKPAQTIAFDVVFEYSNGLELVAPFRIEVSDGDYYFVENSDGGKTYYVFNAANLSSTLQLTISSKDKIVQCFDVFWTADRADIIGTVNAYTADTKLSDAYAGTELLSNLENIQHPNPEYDITLGNPENLSLRDYLGLNATESLGDVPLRRLVKELNTVPYGSYGKEGEATLYAMNKGGFAGSYTVMKSAGDTGLTDNDDYYGIYGLELHSVNVSAQDPDATHVGMFASLASGANITGITFVNPKVEYVGSKGEDGYAGVLAGTATGAKINNVTVKKLGGSSAYVSGIRRMTASSVWVGGIVGYAASGTTVKDCAVSGLDIVAASLAGNPSKAMKTVMAGGIAGEIQAPSENSAKCSVSDTSVSDCRILLERNNQYRNYYMSYAGGIAARAAGEINNVNVTSTLMRDCECAVDVEAVVPYSTYSVANETLVADRIGGVVADVNDSLTVDSANVSGIVIRAFDIAGGILAEIANKDAITVSVTNSTVGPVKDENGTIVEKTDIRVYGSSNVASASATRKYYNAVGGVVGKIENLASLNIDSCNFDGYAGTYSYDNLNKDCTAGGIIGFVTDALSTLDAITVYNSTVSGEIVGYRTSKTDNFIPYLGAAGGIIGKINTFKAKSADSTTVMVSDCVMGASVNLYNNVNGQLVEAAPSDKTHTISTNVGKLLGTLVENAAVTDGEGNSTTSVNFASAEVEKQSNGSFTKYFNNIYVSSYPQNIVAYGSKDFYGAQLSPYDTYTDINKVIVDDQTGESEGALAVGGMDMSGVSNPTFTDDSYSSMAIIPLDADSDQEVSASRAFRVKYNEITFGNRKITFLGKPSIVTDSELANATVSATESLADKGDGYYYGILDITKVTTIIIGEIVMDYDFGLQVNVGFIGMDIEGDGSEGNKFKVTKPEHLYVAFASPDKHYIQTNDIDLSEQYSYSDECRSPIWGEAKSFKPIGTASKPFTGSYNGQGYLIENLYINMPDADNIGLFGYAKNANISNVHIEIAGEMSLCFNKDDYSDVDVVYGNVTGKENVGGLIGYASNVTVNNCSVVKGNVIGETAVGGLIGAAEASPITSCFTSTTAYAYRYSESSAASAKTAGGLIGTVNGSFAISGSFTLGLAALDPNYTTKNGAVGGFVGYVNSGSVLTIDNAVVGASVSDSVGYYSGSVSYRGLTVGAGDGAVNASNIVIAAATTAGESINNDTGKVNAVVNPVYGSVSGATIGQKTVGENTVSTVIFDKGLNGNLVNRTETAATASGFSVADITIGTNNINDAYTAAYADFAKLNINVSDIEIAERGSAYQRGGLFYPLTVKGEGLTFTSSTIDLADKSVYPPEMDKDFRGNGDNKNTDLLFKDIDGGAGTTVYLNIYDMALTDEQKTGLYYGKVNGGALEFINDGTPYLNGELFYDCTMPYFTLTKQAGDYTLYRKVVYPVQAKYDEANGISGRIYPIATERQFNALSGYELTGTFGVGSFEPDKNYALVENITLGNYESKTINNFTGVFDGKGHTVSNLTIDEPESDNIGLFSTLTTGTVKNLRVLVNNVTGRNNVGGLVGYIGPNGSDPSRTTISGCSVGIVNDGSGVYGTQYVGGLVGYAVCGVKTGTNEKAAGIYESYTDTVVNGNNVVGGLVGYSEMVIDNCYSTGDVNAVIDATNDAPRGIGGLVGALFSSANASAAKTQVTNSFSSSAVDVSEVKAYNNKGNGVGGLIGNVATGTTISTVFSSGSVRFCYGDDVDINNLVTCESSPAIGIGGLVGILNSDTTNVYSAASVAAKVGALTKSDSSTSYQGSVVGIGGVAGVVNATIQNAYSSGSTLGMTKTTENLEDYNYGVGGVIGLISSNSASAKSLYFDSNVSAVSNTAVGKNNIDTQNAEGIDSLTTKEFTSFDDVDENPASAILGNEFGSTKGAYPYLTSFFNDNVSLVIRLNALLSIVAIQLNERDETAVKGEGISMAMDIPTAVINGDYSYVYDFDADNTIGDSATSIVDEQTNTLSVQRTSNTKEQANFVIRIKEVGKKVTDENGNVKYEYSPTDENGVVYSQVASRPLSRVCAQMLGTKDYPYLVASQADLKHVAMTDEEYNALSNDVLYKAWGTPIYENGNPVENGDQVFYRMMGYFDLDSGYDRSFSTELDKGYSFDGNGYSIRNLSTTLADTLDANSVITNVNFENVTFESNESLVGTVNGSVIGVNVVNGKASGSNVAGIANTVGESGLIKGCVSDLDYNANSGENIAGLALTNNGKIEMSASVGNIKGTSLKNVSGLVLTNNSTVKNSFTLGDIELVAPEGVVAGFVGTNTGTVDACYTRCNLMVTNADVSKLSIGSFAGNNSGEISAAFAAGLFDVKAPVANEEGATAQPAALSNIFISSNTGKLDDVMFDKQLSGTCFKDIFTYAESTSDILTMANHSALVYATTTDEGETPPKYSKAEDKNLEYPQLKAILDTEYIAPEDDGTEEKPDEELTEEEKAAKAEQKRRTTESRMYRLLRSYSQLSSSTAVVANDNYIDNAAVGSKTPMSFNNYVKWDSENRAVGESTLVNGVGTGPAFEAIADGTSKVTATVKIEDFYNTADTSKFDGKLNLYFTVNGNGANPNFAGGNGSSTDPYKISTKEQVVALSYYGKNPNSYFKVVNDIDMSNTDWNAYIEVFKSNLDGDGHVLSNINIPAGDAENKLSRPFINSLDGGSISNIGLTGIKVTTATNGASALLATKALNNASVTNCVVFGELNAPTGSNVGGLFGETDGATVIDGCIVSGKINSGAKYVGGLIGKATDGAVITNCLSTALVLGSNTAGDTATGGILGSGSATVTNTVVAGNVKGAVAGNIAGISDNVTVTNSYYDKQLSTVDGGATASTTYYLTGAAAEGAFGNSMSWINGFDGYPIPTALVASTGALLNAVKLASAKITFANGVGAGTSTTFTTATPTVVSGADLGVSGLASSYISADKQTTPIKWKTGDTGSMVLGQVYGGELTYTLSSMTRYVDIAVGKQVKAVRYTISNLSANSKSIVSVITGNGGAATAATAFDTAPASDKTWRTLCSDMIFSYDIVGDSVQLFRVETQLPDTYKQGNVTAVFKNSSNGSTVKTVTVATDENGIAYIAIPKNTEAFDSIDITVEAVKADSIWGIRNLYSLFR